MLVGNSCWLAWMRKNSCFRSDLLLHSFLKPPCASAEDLNRWKLLNLHILFFTLCSVVHFSSCKSSNAELLMLYFSTTFHQDVKYWQQCFCLTVTLLLSSTQILPSLDWAVVLQVQTASPSTSLHHSVSSLLFRETIDNRINFTKKIIHRLYFTYSKTLVAEKQYFSKPICTK